MLFLLLLLLAPNVIPNTMVLEYRIFIQGVPINIFDVLIAVGVIGTILPSATRLVTQRAHPLFVWTSVFLWAAALGGAIVAVMVGRDSHYFVTATRDYLTLPLCVYLGYRLLKTPGGNLVITYVQLMSSVFSAVLSVVFIRSTSVMLAETGSSQFDLLRNTRAETAGDSGTIMMYLLLFAFVSKVRLLNRPVGLLLIALGLGSEFLLPHRSAWVSIAVLIVFAVGFLPRQPLSRRFAALGVALAGAIGVGVIAVTIVSWTSGRDFGEYISTRLRSLLPGDQEGVKMHAWDTRIPGTIRELQLWAASPIVGRGFGIQEVDSLEHQELSYRHNTWTSIMAETGTVGLIGALLVTVGTMVVGYRLVRDHLDRGSTLLGAMCAIIAAGYFVSGFLTMTFNKERSAIVLGLACGMVSRCRAMQLAIRQQWAGYVDANEAGALGAELDFPVPAQGYAGALSSFH